MATTTRKKKTHTARSSSAGGTATRRRKKKAGTRKTTSGRSTAPRRKKSSRKASSASSSRRSTSRGKKTTSRSKVPSHRADAAIVEALPDPVSSHGASKEAQPIVEPMTTDSPATAFAPLALWDSLSERERTVAVLCSSACFVIGLILGAMV